MSTSKPMTTIIFDDDTFRRIEDFRFSRRFSSRSQAVLYLIKAGMDALKDEYPELDPANDSSNVGNIKKIQLTDDEEQKPALL